MTAEGAVVVQGQPLGYVAGGRIGDYGHAIDRAVIVFNSPNATVV